MTFVTGVILLAIVTGLACAIPGTFLVLQKKSMLIDAMSHAVLPGIVFAYAFTGTLNSPWLILGAGLSGMIVVAGSELLERSGLVAGDAPQGLIFPALFSVGVLMISMNFHDVHLDTHTVLVGDLNFAAFHPLHIGGINIGPQYLYVMAAVLLLNIVFVAATYKELVLATFDPQLAASLGIKVRLFNYSFMFLVSITITAAFYAAGAILTIALVVVPAATAWLISNSMRALFTWTVIITVAAAWISFWIAYATDTATSAMMALCYGLAFLSVYGAARSLRNRRQKTLTRAHLGAK